MDETSSQHRGTKDEKIEHPDITQELTDFRMHACMHAATKSFESTQHTRGKLSPCLQIATEIQTNVDTSPDRSGNPEADILFSLSLCVYRDRTSSSRHRYSSLERRFFAKPNSF